MTDASRTWCSCTDRATVFTSAGPRSLTTLVDAIPGLEVHMVGEAVAGPGHRH